MSEPGYRSIKGARFERTGEWRTPQFGEWFERAPEGMPKLQQWERFPDDDSTPAWILRRVEVET